LSQLQKTSKQYIGFYGSINEGCEKNHGCNFYQGICRGFHAYGSASAIKMVRGVLYFMLGRVQDKLKINIFICPTPPEKNKKIDQTAPFYTLPIAGAFCYYDKIKNDWFT